MGIYQRPAQIQPFREFSRTTVSVVTPTMLYRMKKGTVRPKDHVDAARIAQRFGIKGE